MQEEDRKTDVALIFKQASKLSFFKLSIILALLISGTIFYSVITKAGSQVVVVDGDDSSQYVTKQEFKSAISKINERFNNLIVKEKTNEKVT